MKKAITVSLFFIVLLGSSINAVDVKKDLKKVKTGIQSGAKKVKEFFTLGEVKSELNKCSMKHCNGKWNKATKWCLRQYCDNAYRRYIIARDKRFKVQGLDTQDAIVAGVLVGSSMMNAAALVGSGMYIYGSTRQERHQKLVEIKKKFPDLSDQERLDVLDLTWARGVHPTIDHQPSEKVIEAAAELEGVSTYQIKSRIKTSGWKENPMYKKNN